MRDPLRNVSVRYKLAFAFLGVCLLAFGVGGFLVSRSARESLEREIRTVLRLRSQSCANSLESDLRALGLRARDFASDGYIRDRFERLIGGGKDAGKVRADLRRHLIENKLPLEPAFRNIALSDAGGENLFLARVEDREWASDLPPVATGGGDWFSGWLVYEGAEESPSIVIATPLHSLEGDLEGNRVIGTLLIRVGSAVWIAGALDSVGEDGEPTPDFSLRLMDRDRRTVEILPALLSLPADSVRFAERGPVLRVRGPIPERAPKRGMLSQSFSLEVNGWCLETSMRSQDALAAASGLQARFLIVGVVLAAAACFLLMFPMRFLARPIRQLRDAARQIREGDFSARVPVESTDEIGELSRSFNLMAEAVEERAEKLGLAARSLEQRKNELRRERDRLNAVILSMRDGLIVLDADGEPEVWNAAAGPLRAIVQNGGLELRSHRKCHQASANRFLQEDFGQEDFGNGGAEGAAGGEHPCLKCLFDPVAPPRSCLVEAGDLVYEVHSTKLASQHDGRSGRVLVARDVTDRVAHDEREIHQERLAVLGEVAAVMAHELNNPLAAICMFAQMIGSKLPEGSPLLEDVDVIERNTRACTRTIRELLDYATGATPEVGPVDVHANLREVASFLRAVHERQDTDLVLALEAEDPVVVGDEVQLRQVFVNLVMNALQAVGEGRVEVRTWLEENHLVVDVADDGPGIPAELSDTVFKPFYTTKPRGSGTGLGLSTARRIAEIQGGGLELVDGRPGQTTFRVRLLRSGL